jgi:hypothetical protein
LYARELEAKDEHYFGTLEPLLCPNAKKEVDRSGQRFS